MKLLSALLTLVMSLHAIPVLATPISVADAMKTRGTVLLIRHALAPGFGDPANFQVDDCSTQRNLNDTGRQQARAIGVALRNAGADNTEVLSSPWCRCLETATEMALGPVIPFDGLSSFFQGHADRGETLRLLRERLATVQSSDPPLIMVTHQVVISALTGQGTRSGGAVLYDPKKLITITVAMPEPPYE